MKSPSILTVVKLLALPTKGDAVIAVMQELASSSREERGCQRFEVLQQVTEPTRFITVERWTSEAAAEEHMRSAHVQRALARLTELLARPPLFVRYRNVEASESPMIAAARRDQPAVLR